MLSVAVRVPRTEGVKRITIVQLSPLASELPQLLFCEKSAALVPVMLMLEMVTALPVLLVAVTVSVGLDTPMASAGKFRLLVERLSPLELPAPVPVRLTDCALTLLAMFTVAARLPLAEGVKVTLIEQLEPAATLEPQVLD